MMRYLLPAIGAVYAVAVCGCAADAPDVANAPMTAGADLGPGCAPARPTVAHRAGGVVVEGRGTAPIPCAVPTGPG